MFELQFRVINNRLFLLVVWGRFVGVLELRLARLPSCCWDFPFFSCEPKAKGTPESYVRSTLIFRAMDYYFTLDPLAEDRKNPVIETMFWVHWGILVCPFIWLIGKVGNHQKRLNSDPVIPFRVYKHMHRHILIDIYVHILAYTYQFCCLSKALQHFIFHCITMHGHLSPDTVYINNI